MGPSIAIPVCGFLVEDFWLRTPACVMSAGRVPLAQDSWLRTPIDSLPLTPGSGHLDVDSGLKAYGAYRLSRFEIFGKN